MTSILLTPELRQLLHAAYEMGRADEETGHGPRTAWQVSAELAVRLANEGKKEETLQ